jgi:hypothetical protein
MKTLQTVTRTLAFAAAIAAASTLPSPAAAARVGAGHVAAAGWHGGPGHFRGGYWGHRGYWPGAFWGGVGLGLGIGAVGYYGGYYGGYYAPYPGYYYYDAPLVVAPVYGAEPGAAVRSGQPVPQQAAADPIFYPRNGQSAEATEADRRECNRWATTQRGAMADAAIFQRATFACMEGRGYTAK